ncbi:MAG: hypothetical protein ACO1QB_11380 [Verrucomicrobiales bacterium]
MPFFKCISLLALLMFSGCFEKQLSISLISKIQDNLAGISHPDADGYVLCVNTTKQPIQVEIQRGFFNGRLKINSTQETYYIMDPTYNRANLELSIIPKVQVIQPGDSVIYPLLIKKTFVTSGFSHNGIRDWTNLFNRQEKVTVQVIEAFGRKNKSNKLRLE